MREQEGLASSRYHPEKCFGHRGCYRRAVLPCRRSSGPRPGAILSVRAECGFFEYYLASADVDWLIADTDHN